MTNALPTPTIRRAGCAQVEHCGCRGQPPGIGGELRPAILSYSWKNAGDGSPAFFHYLTVFVSTLSRCYRLSGRSDRTAVPAFHISESLISASSFSSCSL